MNYKIPNFATEFKYIPINDYDGYYSYRGDGYELCLEPCLNGFDVGLYSHEGELLFPVKCTRLTGIYTQSRAYKSAIIIILELYKQYEAEKQRLRTKTARYVNRLRSRPRFYCGNGREA